MLTKYCSNELVLFVIRGTVRHDKQHWDSNFLSVIIGLPNKNPPLHLFLQIPDHHDTNSQQTFDLGPDKVNKIENQSQVQLSEEYANSTSITLLVSYQDKVSLVAGITTIFV